MAPLGTHSVEHSNLRAVVKLKNTMKQDTSTEASITKGVCSVCLIHLHEHLSSRQLIISHHLDEHLSSSQDSSSSLII